MQLEQLERARVVTAAREHYIVWTESGAECHAVLSGRFRHSSSDWPATGDWVTLRDHTVIEAVLPRRTRISRKRPGAAFDEQVLAANVDRLFIVTGLDRDYNPRRLERYLLLAAESGAAPVIVLNKADLHGDVTPFVRETEALSEAPVLAVSALCGDGLERLPAMVAPGETAALLGSSGAGKSTILNALLGEDRMRTSAVRDSDQRGRHTTTHRELLRMPGGWLLIDMPGLRELQLWADPEAAGDAFAEVEALAAQCRFHDCKHQGEPGCAVVDGVDPARLAGYHKLTRELAHLERQRDVHAAIEEKKRWKSIHKQMRNWDKRR